MTQLSNDIKLDFDDVLLVPQRTKTASRKNVHMERRFEFYHSTRSWQGVPVIASNMDTTGTFAMGNALTPYHMITCIHKHYTLKECINQFTSWGNDSRQLSAYPEDNVLYSLGIKDDDFYKLCDFVSATNIIPNICIDVANGYTEDFVEFCADVRDRFDNKPIIIAGNVCTPEMVQELILHGGVDIVKVGIGPGSACTTRLKTGVGYPQLSAVMECAHAAHGLKSEEKRLGLICADGGCRTPSDVAKAFAANADFVMMGGMLAGTEECDGEWQYEIISEQEEGGYGQYYKGTRKKALQFYGMSSQKAQEKHGNGLKNYRSSEGRILEVPFKGSASAVVQDVLGGLRSCCAYIGATSLKDMSKCAEFIRVNRTHFDQSV